MKVGQTALRSETMEETMNDNDLYDLEIVKEWLRNLENLEAN
jgi:hypothetical protein